MCVEETLLKQEVSNLYSLDGVSDGMINDKEVWESEVEGHIKQVQMIQCLTIVCQSPSHHSHSECYFFLSHRQSTG